MAIPDKSIADYLGRWVDPDFQSGLILRCKEAWGKPLNQLTNLELATFLTQDIGVNHVLPVAKDRVSRKIEDDSEYYEGQLIAAIESALRRQKN